MDCDTNVMALFTAIATFGTVGGIICGYFGRKSMDNLAFHIVRDALLDLKDYFHPGTLPEDIINRALKQIATVYHDDQT